MFIRKNLHLFWFFSVLQIFQDQFDSQRTWLIPWGGAWSSFSYFGTVAEIKSRSTCQATNSSFSPPMTRNPEIEKGREDRDNKLKGDFEILMYA